jgi:hypothetical protein
MNQQKGSLREHLLASCLADIIATLGESSGMPESQSAGALQGVVGEILKAAAKKGSQAAAVRRTEAELRSIAQHDYDAAVRQHFDRRQLRRILKEVRRSLPTLNCEVYRVTEIDRLREIAEKLGVILQARAFPGSQGAGFRGFYVNEAENLKHPLIWVNTAAPPVAAAAAFWHEIGHHLTNPILEDQRATTSMSFGSNYREHLADPREIAADMVRVLAGYPKPIALQLFGGSDADALRADVDLLVARAMSHVRSVMGYNFRNRRSPKEEIYYLGGMIHTAKLRMTLLSEYDI